MPSSWLYIDFGSAESHKARAQEPDWWYRPAIPHQKYPIDLLPNFSLEAPDPKAGIGPIISKPTAYWAVRGTKDPKTARPYTTFCSMQPPPNTNRGDISHQRDVTWLLQASTYDAHIGNTCRGGVGADNGKRIGAMIDVPGAALEDITQIYQAVSKHLSEMTVD